MVVQELFMTETAKHATVILPGASFLEKEGTFTNGERRIQRVNKVVEPLEGTKSDGQIIVDVMNRMGYEQPDYSADGILKEISQIVPFFKGVVWEELGDNGKMEVTPNYYTSMNLKEVKGSLSSSHLKNQMKLKRIKRTIHIL